MKADYCLNENGFEEDEKEIEQWYMSIKDKKINEVNRDEFNIIAYVGVRKGCRKGIDISNLSITAIVSCVGEYDNENAYKDIISSIEDRRQEYIKEFINTAKAIKRIYESRRTKNR